MTVPLRGVGWRWLGAPALRWLVAAGLGVLVTPARAAQSVVEVREHELKAAALYNIISFTDWPAAAFATPDAPLVVGVLGDGPVSEVIERLVANETWHGRRLIVRSFRTARDVEDCHVLWIARSDYGTWGPLRSRFARSPVLLVSDAPQFARNGGTVQFAIERNRLRLVINLDRARAGGLTISSKVLRLAEIIGGPEP